MTAPVPGWALDRTGSVGLPSGMNELDSRWLGPLTEMPVHRFDELWRETLGSLTSGPGEVPPSRAADESRGAWLWLADLKSRHRALDLSGGLGSQAAALALHFEQVICTEHRPWFRDFLQTRFQQNGTTNVHLLESEFPLPLKGGTVDCIAAHGGPPTRRRFSRALADECFRLLCPGGVLSVAVDYRSTNRLEDRLRGVFRARATEQTLRSAGFRSVERYYVLPSNEFPVCLIPEQTLTPAGMAGLGLGGTILASVVRSAVARVRLHAALFRSLLLLGYR